MKPYKTIDETVSGADSIPTASSGHDRGYNSLYAKAGMFLLGAAAILGLSALTPSKASAAEQQCNNSDYINPPGKVLEAKLRCKSPTETTTPTIKVHKGETLAHAIEDSAVVYDEQTRQRYVKQATEFLTSLGYNMNAEATREGIVPLCIATLACDPNRLGRAEEHAGPGPKTPPPPVVVNEVTLDFVIKYFKGLESKKRNNGNHYVKDVNTDQFSGHVTTVDYPYRTTSRHLVGGKERRGIRDFYFDGKHIGALRYKENGKIIEVHINGEIDPELLTRTYRVSNFSVRGWETGEEGKSKHSEKYRQATVDTEQIGKRVVYTTIGLYLGGAFGNSPLFPPSGNGGGSTPTPTPQSPPPGPVPGN